MGERVRPLPAGQADEGRRGGVDPFEPGEDALFYFRGMIKLASGYVLIVLVRPEGPRDLLTATV